MSLIIDWMKVAEERNMQHRIESVLWYNDIMLAFQSSSANTGCAMDNTCTSGRVCGNCDFFSPFGQRHIEAFGPCERHPHTGYVYAGNKCRFRNGFVWLHQQRFPINIEGLPG